MLLASELGVSLAILIQISFGQSTVSSNYYQQISIEVSTWNDITAPHTLAGLELLLITSFHDALLNENIFSISDHQELNVQPCVQLTHNV